MYKTWWYGYCCTLSSSEPFDETPIQNSGTLGKAIQHRNLSILFTANLYLRVWLFLILGRQPTHECGGGSVDSEEVHANKGPLS